MFVKQILSLIILFNLCRAQNILNLLDFAAPLFGLIKADSGIDEACYDELGCFRNDGEFAASPLRPISCVPQSPQLIGTEFLFFSRSSPDEPQTFEAFDSHLFSDIAFDPTKKTKIIIHGYKEGLILQGFSHVLIHLIRL